MLFVITLPAEKTSPQCEVCNSSLAQENPHLKSDHRTPGQVDITHVASGKPFEVIYNVDLEIVDMWNPEGPSL